MGRYQIDLHDGDATKFTSPGGEVGAKRRMEGFALSMVRRALTRFAPAMLRIAASKSTSLAGGEVDQTMSSTYYIGRRYSAASMMAGAVP
ncbi:hypothetical protein [Bradyrhizobium sp.]|uniref:hypothetical protein n=1 Tax=Bradyrhizobium sp. TaxID=376 RepID=UPI003C644D38